MIDLSNQEAPGPCSMEQMFFNTSIFGLPGSIELSRSDPLVILGSYHSLKLELKNDFVVTFLF